MISKGKKDVAVVMVAGGFMKATVPFLVFYFSAQILNNAIEGDYEACVKSVAALLLSQFVCELVNRFCQKRIEVLGESCQQIIRQQMADKAFELQYEKFEKQETLDALRHAKLTAGGSGDIKDQVDTCYQIFVQFFSMCYSVVFFLLLLLKIDAEQKKTFFVSYGSTLLLIGLYAVVVIVNLYLGKILSAKQYEFIHANDHNNALGGYLAGIMTDERNSKDIRLYDLSKLFLGKFRQMVEGYSIYLQMGKVNGKYRGMIEGINQFAAGAAYLLAGMKALNGMIDIGNVILYAGVISQTVNCITEFGSQVISFQFCAEYLSVFDKFIQSPAMAYDGTLPIEKRDDGQYEFEFHDVSFAYPDCGTQVLSHVSLKFNIGEKMALVGQNGAGKTTLIKLLCRLYEPTEGTITLNGIDIWKYNYEEYTRAFSVVFQDFAMFSLPVGENIAASSAVDEERAWEVLEEVELAERVRKMKDGLKTQLYNNNGAGVDVSGGEAQRLAIARALYKDAPFVILDEPTAALDPIAEAQIYENFNEMVENKTAIYISHRMEEVFANCDTITVMRDGQTISSRPTEETNMDQIVGDMVGRVMSEYYPARTNVPGDEVFTVEGFSQPRVFEDISFNVRKGEILGVAGLMGAGRTEIMRAVFGVDPHEKGKLFFEGKEIHIKKPLDAIRQGFGFITENRKSEGLILDFSIERNIALPSEERLAKSHVINEAEEFGFSSDLSQRLGVKALDIHLAASTLSGGNQQKVVIAKWVGMNPKLLILDEPTRGIDIGAKKDIYDLMNELTAKGVSIIMVSSELPEVIGMSDRILVIHEGKVAGIVEHKDATQTRIMTLATGGE